MSQKFKEGDKVFLKPNTFHNQRGDSPEAIFIRYMAGDQYSILMIQGFDGFRRIRVNIEDLET